MNQLEHGLYPFSETNLENSSRTLIDFSRSLDFTFNTLYPRFQNQFSLGSKYISYNINSENFIA